MENSSLLTKWMDINQRYNHIWSILILTLMSVSFVVTDWMVGIFTLSDYIFAIVGASLVISGNYRVKRNQLLWILLLVGVIVMNIIMNDKLNVHFATNSGRAALIRLSYYVAIVTGVYNYVKNYKLEAQFLRILNIVAILVGVIGIYITIALYSEGKLPFEVFWTFTRMDEASYFFKENSALIRTRSVFSEPAYLGYYLNIILSLNLFNKKGVNISRVFTVLISVTIVLTFSYGAVGTMILIFSLYFFKKVNLKKIKLKRITLTKKTAVYFFLFLVFIVLFWDFIDETIIKRSINILTGEDISALNRLVTSWKYVNTDQIFLGNGIGHTPNIWNIYAYILSDLGLIAFILSCIFTLYLLFINLELGMIFIALNFQKGGYLNPAFSIFLLLVFIYMGNHKERKQRVLDS